MRELCQSEYSLFPNLWNHLRSLRCRITHTQGKSYAGLLPSLVMSFDKIVNGKLSLLGFKRSYANWVDLRQMTTDLFWSNQWPQQPCHFIPFFKRRRKWHFSRFPSTNKTPRQQLVQKKWILSPLCFPFPVSLCTSLPHHSRSQMAYNPEYSCSLGLRLAS